jgi:hypothetical protein
VGAGNVQINAGYGNATSAASITQTSGDPSQIVLVSVDRQSIGIRGSGDPQSATMVFQVRSADGIPVGEGVTVSFELVARTNGGTGSGEFLEPLSDVTDASGIVRTTLNSGTVAGATETVARITAGDETILSQVISVSIDGGLPVARNLTVASQELNIPGLCFYNVRTPVLALVYDAFQNPVPEGTIVYFTTQYGGIVAADTTDAFGAARVELISANALPPVWSGVGPAGFPYGFTKVYAQTADAEGDQILDSTFVLFSGCSVLENIAPSGFAIADGGCQEFQFNLWDQNQNPLSAGTRITVSSTAGTLGGDIDVLLPDTQAGYTSFTVVLCDGDPGDIDPETSAAISIRVTSRNNDVSAVIRGTID